MQICGYYVTRLAGWENGEMKKIIYWGYAFPRSIIALYHQKMLTEERLQHIVYTSVATCKASTH